MNSLSSVRKVGQNCLWQQGQLLQHGANRHCLFFLTFWHILPGLKTVLWCSRNIKFTWQWACRQRHVSCTVFPSVELQLQCVYRPKDSCFFYRNHLLDFYTWKMVSRSPKIQLWQGNRNDILIFLHAAHRFLWVSICIYLRDSQNLPTKYFMFLSRASARWSSLSGHDVWQNAEYLTWVTVSLADFYLSITLSSILLWRLESWQ